MGREMLDEEWVLCFTKLAEPRLRELIQRPEAELSDGLAKRLERLRQSERLTQGKSDDH
jgi:hypothetical protein